MMTATATNVFQQKISMPSIAFISIGCMGKIKYHHICLSFFSLVITDVIFFAIVALSPNAYLMDGVC